MDIDRDSGGRGTPLYKLYVYVPPHRVGFCAVFVWKRVYTLPILVWNRPVWFLRELRVEEEILAIEQTPRLRWVLCYDYLFISRTQLEYDVMFSRTFYDKIRTG